MKTRTHKMESHTASTLAKRLGVSEREVDRLLAARLLKAVKKCGPNSSVFNAADLDALKGSGV